jgi:hypothetical protein
VTTAIRSFMTRSDTSPSQIAALRKDHSIIPSTGPSNAQRMIGMRVRQLERVGDGAISDVAAVHI